MRRRSRWPAPPRRPPPRSPERAAESRDCPLVGRLAGGSRRLSNRRGTLPRRALALLAHGERTTSEGLPVERADRGLGLRVAGELDEGETPRAASFAVGHDLDLLD